MLKKYQNVIIMTSLKKRITINTMKLFEIISGKDIDVFFTRNEEKRNNHKVNEQLFYVELDSNIRKNKLSKILNDDKRRNIK